MSTTKKYSLYAVINGRCYSYHSNHWGVIITIGYVIKMYAYIMGHSFTDNL